MKKRTSLDFSKHELFIIENDLVKIHHLKKPNTNIDNIKFINCQGIMTVTGDYGNWVFCRQFIPVNSGETVSGGYWKEKLRISSSQEPDEFNPELTTKQINELLLEEDISEEHKEYYEELLSVVDEGEFWYKSKAYGDIPRDLDAESVPCAMKTQYWLLVIFDAFEEICSRLPKETN